MAQCHLKAALIRHTADMQELAALGASLCYSRADVDTLQKRIEEKVSAAFA